LRTEYHALARARGIQGGTGSRCRMCGTSPFDVAGKAESVFGIGFSDWAWVTDAAAPDVCTGCAHLLGGRPGDDPPPIRMWSFTLADGVLNLCRPKDLWRWLVEPPDGNFLVSWATSGKIPHWIRARWSTKDLILVGHDRETVEYRPEKDRALLDAVHQLLYSPTGTGPLLSRAAIKDGTYHPKSTATFGTAEWASLEATVARYRPSLLLDLVCACAPLFTERARKEEEGVIDNLDMLAAKLLAHIAEGSDMRRNDGKLFWGGFFRHRVERFRRLPLPDLVSRLLGECQVPAMSTAGQAAAKLLQEFDESMQDSVATSIRERPDLVVALVYDLTRKERL
jgi:hypothetical protein